MSRLAIASCRELIAAGRTASSTATYGVSSHDEVHLYNALDAAGVPYVSLAWDEGDAASWAAYPLVVVRTCWDYSTGEARAARFRSWLRSLEASGCRVLNPAQALVWNVDKRVYLSALSARGVPTIPTEYLAAESPASACDLSAIALRRGWEGGALLLKPSVGGSSRGCLRV